ncbi:hypothetical protein R1sor_005919 [Riccia sorocarpa]|uniref:Uncharacterized protein n=1 Tax=Riccia sorocarpa TaxID=122646 RepID=A0ABD3HKX9_9MARC
MCAGGIHAVKILHGDGQVLSLAAPNLKVGDVLIRHPHHYMCHMSPDQSNKSTMLPLDTELEPGSVYFLLPLPRLFPGNSTSPSCSCYMRDKLQRREGDHHHLPFQKVAGEAFKQMITRIGSPMRGPKKISPDISSSRSEPSSTNPYSPNYGKENLSPVYKRNKNSPKRSSRSRSRSPSRYANPFAEDPPVCNRWKPRLGCISETDALVTAYEELRLSLDRRRLTFECRGRPSSPLRYGELSRSPSRTSSAGVYCRSPSRELRSSTPEPCTQKQTMSLGGYLFIRRVSFQPCTRNSGTDQTARLWRSDHQKQGFYRPETGIAWLLLMNASNRFKRPLEELGLLSKCVVNIWFSTWQQRIANPEYRKTLPYRDLPASP